MRLKNDSQNYSWKQIYGELKNDFGRESLPAVNEHMLRKAFQKIDWKDDNATTGAVSTSQQGILAAEPTGPVGGSFRLSQAGYNPAYATPSSYPGSSYGVPQSNPGGVFGASPPSPWVQHAPSGSGGPYTPGTNAQFPPIAHFEPVRNQAYGYGYGGQYASAPHSIPQLPPTASFDADWRQKCGYGGHFASPPNTNQHLPPVAALALGNEGDHHGDSPAMTPGMGRGPGPDHGGDSGFNNEYQHASPTARFTQQQLDWILQRGLWYSEGYGWGKIAREYEQAFNKEKGEVDSHRLKQAFEEMRK